MDLYLSPPYTPALSPWRGSPCEPCSRLEIVLGDGIAEVAMEGYTVNNP